MNRSTIESLVAHLPLLLEAPNGHANLRRLILEFAVAGKISTDLNGGDISSGELPRGWKLTDFGELVEFSIGKTPSTKDSSLWSNGSDSIMWVSIADMRDGGWIDDSSRRVSRKSQQDVFRRAPWAPGTLLMSFKLTIGKTSRLAKPAYFNEAIIAFQSPERTTDEYLFRVLPLLAKRGRSRDAIKGQTLNSKSIAALAIPLPPLCEQAVLVERIDELMALCDQLEEAQTKRDSIRTAARKSAIEAVAKASTSQELEVAWKRISRNWDVMADTPESLEDLRQMILAVAMKGHLSADSETWRQIPLGDVVKIRTGKLDANASSLDGEYPFFTCAKNPLRISTYSYDTECVLLAGNGNFDVNYYSGKFDAYQRTYIIEPKDPSAISVRFIYRYMQRHSKELLKQSIGGVIKYIKIGFLTNAPFPLPSFAEQERIVAKVDELMALCDQLEEQLESRDAIAEKFAGSVTASEPL